MKTLLKSMLAGLALVSFAAVAVPQVNAHAGYTSSKQAQHMGAKAAVRNALNIPPTYILIVNDAKYDSFYAVVPNTPIDDFVSPDAPLDHIINWNGSFWTTVQLEDTYHGVFYAGSVSPHAVIVVRGATGSFSAQVFNS